MSRCIVSSLLYKTVLATALCGSLYVPIAAADGAGLSREDIMRQNRALAQQHQGDTSSEGGGSSDEATSLAPPMSSSDEAPSSSPSASTSSGAGSSLIPQLLERVSALEGQVREMRGEVDQLTNQLHQDEANTSKQFSDMQFALQGSGGHAAASTPRVAPKTESAAPNAAEALQQGKAALKAHRYSEAEQQARAALKTAHSAWGKTEAQFLLAQSLAGQKSYRSAAVAYYDTYTHDPHSERAPEALLGVSGAMLALGDKSDSCQALQRLSHEFPNPSARVKASEKVFRERAACH